MNDIIDCCSYKINSILSLKINIPTNKWLNSINQIYQNKIIQIKVKCDMNNDNNEKKYKFGILYS